MATTQEDAAQLADNLVRNTINSLTPAQRKSFDALDTAQQISLIREINSIKESEVGSIEQGDPMEDANNRLAQFHEKSKNAVRDTGLGVIEGVTLGVPRMAIEAATGKDLPRGNVLGQLVGFSSPAKAITEGVKRFAAPHIVKATGKTAGPILSDMLSAATQGFVFPQNKFDPVERAAFAAGGMALGGTISGTSKFVKAFKKSTQAKKELRELGEKKRRFDASQESELPNEIGEEEAFLKKRQTQLINQEKEGLREQTKLIRSEINKEAQKQAKEIKEPLVRWMRAYKDNWGNRLDDALANAKEQGITTKELNEMADSVIRELIDDGVNPDGATVKAVRVIVNRTISRFTPKATPQSGPQILGPSGKPIRQPKATAPEEDIIISNKDLLTIKRSISQSMSPSARRAGQFTEADLAAVSFNKQLMSRLADSIDDLKPLNAEYKDFSDLARFSYRHFTPKGSQYEITNGTKFFKKYAEGKLNDGEMAALRNLEKETGISFSRNLAKLEQDLFNMNQSGRDAQSRIEAAITKRLRDLSAKKKLAGQANKKTRTDIDNEMAANRQILEDLSTVRKVVGTLGFLTVAGLTISLLNALGAPKIIRTLLDLSR